MIRLITTRRLRNLRHLVGDAQSLAARLDAKHAAWESLAASWGRAMVQRDQARNIAVDLEQQLAAAEDGTGIRLALEQRDTALAQAETARAAAEAADLPIGLDVTPDDWHRAVKAAIADPTGAELARVRRAFDGLGGTLDTLITLARAAVLDADRGNPAAGIEHLREMVADLAEHAPPLDSYTSGADLIDAETGKKPWAEVTA